MPSREPWVTYLHRHIPELEVSWDVGKGIFDTFLRAMRMPKDREGCVMLEDDIILTKDFVVKARAEIEQRPTEIVKFFSRFKDDVTKGSRYMNGRSFSMTQAYYLPPGMAGRIAR